MDKFKSNFTRSSKSNNMISNNELMYATNYRCS